MQTKTFEIEIKATPQKVWEVLWDDLTYMQWTSAFCNGSYIKTDWKLGSSVWFLSPSGNGMYSEISSMELYKTMVFKHIGELSNFKELPIDEKTSQWSGSKESYYLTENNGFTKLKAALDVVEEHISYFDDVFPKALAIVKEIAERNCITITTKVDATVEKVWQYWNEPNHITQWCTASEDWHTPKATNDLKENGKFSTTMAAKDGSVSFDIVGTYSAIKTNELLHYTMEDGRIVKIIFVPFEGSVKIVETFEAENQNSMELQKQGWQNILDNFKTYVENQEA